MINTRKLLAASALVSGVVGSAMLVAPAANAIMLDCSVVNTPENPPPDWTKPPVGLSCKVVPPSGGTGIWGGGNVPMPNPPIANVPGAPGYSPGAPTNPICLPGTDTCWTPPPGGSGPPGIWGGGGVPMPTPPIANAPGVPGEPTVPPPTFPQPPIEIPPGGEQPPGEPTVPPPTFPQPPIEIPPTEPPPSGGGGGGAYTISGVVQLTPVAAPSTPPAPPDNGGAPTG